MNVEDFTLNINDNGNEFCNLRRKPDKNTARRFTSSAVLPKMFATGESRCPVALFKSYLSKRPEDLKLSGLFYLACIDNPTTDAWYKKSRMGKNTISKIMKSMKDNSPLQDMCPEKRLSNHSVRKTVVRKLKAKGVPKSEIILGSLSNDNGDGNENVTNLHISVGKNNSFARPVRVFFTFVHFFAVVSKTEVLWTTSLLEDKFSFSALN